MSRRYFGSAQFPTFYRQRREHRVFSALLEMIPGLEERLLDAGNDGDVMKIAESVCLLTNLCEGSLVTVVLDSERRIQC